MTIAQELRHFPAAVVAAKLVEETVICDCCRMPMKAINVAAHQVERRRLTAWRKGVR